MSDELTPITRTETFLAKAGGQSVETPTPITREETFLQAIIDNGSGGGGGGGVLVVTNGEGMPPSLSETWQTIYDAMASGKLVVISKADEYGAFHSYITEASINEGDYNIFTNFANDNPTYIASNADGYPVLNI